MACHQTKAYMFLKHAPMQVKEYTVRSLYKDTRYTDKFKLQHCFIVDELFQSYLYPLYDGSFQLQHKKICEPNAFLLYV